ncbi:hypothetical protein SGRA_1644 [Saprospira grandis str. Lewin]|uniref:Uncharacterized protein n=1 Tax=Saprospira grandis (strain Lewin) TaxID=984262 RepID=H6LA94_SAPGL|nr:hypothetical protein SGRA_1644 [Saprospira grandis str. Lewin]
MLQFAFCRAKGPQATTSPLGRSSTTEGSNRCGGQGRRPAGLAMRRGGRRPDRAFLSKAKKAKGRADLRAPKRSACRRQEAPKQQRAATTSPLGRSSTTKGSKRSACRRQTTRLQAAVRRLKGVTPQKKKGLLPYFGKKTFCY